MIGELLLLNDLTPIYKPKNGGSVDLYETDTCFVAEVMVTGVPEDKIELHAEGQKLIIKAHEPNNEKQVKYHIRERKSLKFERTINLPYRADMSKITAKLKQGILHVEI